MGNSTLARVYSFDLQFSGSKRTAFYRKLFGFSSHTTRMDRRGRSKTYVHSYPGLLKRFPHLRLGKSVMAVPARAAGKLDRFFRDPKWRPIQLHTFDAILPAEDRLGAMRKAFGRIEVQPGVRLEDEMRFLRSYVARTPPEAEVAWRVRRVFRATGELMELDWSEGRQFSRGLEAELAQLKRYL